MAGPKPVLQKEEGWVLGQQTNPVKTICHYGNTKCKTWEYKLGCEWLQYDCGATMGAKKNFKAHAEKEKELGANPVQIVN